MYDFVEKCEKYSQSFHLTCYNYPMFIYPIIVVAIIAADQITKVMVRNNIALGERIPVISDWMNFTYIRNEGAAFSMFSGNVLVTVVLTSLLLVFCLAFVIHEVKAHETFLAICMTCVLGGGLSNMYDRIHFGYVTDMISCGSFAIFNVADMFVTCGCFLAVFYLLFTLKDEKNAENSKKEGNDE